MPEIFYITLANNLFRILKNEVRNEKNRKGDVNSKVKNTFKKLALLASTNNNNNIEQLNDKKHEKLVITVNPLNINPLINS